MTAELAAAEIKSLQRQKIDREHDIASARAQIELIEAKLLALAPLAEPRPPVPPATVPPPSGTPATGG